MKSTERSTGHAFTVLGEDQRIQVRHMLQPLLADGPSTSSLGDGNASMG